MPSECEVEFIIELKPGTAPIAKRPYRMGLKELEKFKDELRALLAKGYIRPKFVSLGSTSVVCGQEGWITKDVCGLSSS